MTDASAPHEPRPDPSEPRPTEPAPETRLEPSPAPEVRPIELPAVASTPVSASEPPRDTAEGAPHPAAPPRARVYEVEATTLSAGEARVLSSEAPLAEAVVIKPAPSMLAAAITAHATEAPGQVTAPDAESRTGASTPAASATTAGPTAPPPLPPSGAPSETSGAAQTSGAREGVPPPPPSAPPTSPWRRRRQHVWSILCHLFLFLTIPTVFLGATLTFLVWQLKGRDSREVEQNGREALNFQINVAIVTVLLGLTCIGAPLLPIVWLIAAVYAVIAARAASDGETYRYPYVLRIVSH